MKPLLIAVELFGSSAFELQIPVENGSTALCQVFPYFGELRYRYLTRTLVKDAQGTPTGEVLEEEFFSESTYPKMQQQWLALPEEERPEPPRPFSESPLSVYLQKLTRYRQAFQGCCWIPVPGQEIQKAPVPYYDQTAKTGFLTGSAVDDTAEEDEEGNED
jgi:hypothetical protein